MANDLKKLTDPKAVLKAIAECDRLGRDQFLEKYGFKRSRLHLLHFGGKTYDSKAIVGVAYGKQHGSALKFNEFYGGVATVIPALERLGFVAGAVSHPVQSLVKGQTYFRVDLREQFGGQLQKGIWTPAEFPVVFIFSGDSGKKYGYDDGWTEDGIYRYTGEGQLGHMTFTTGNASIRDHRKNGKDLLLFTDLGKGKGVRYEGVFECASWEVGTGLDMENKQRDLLTFHLIPVSSGADFVGTPTLGGKKASKTLESLRQAAYTAAGNEKAVTKASDAKRTWYERSNKVKDYVLARSGGVCEACDEPAPFEKKGGGPYLEPHHTNRLADEGPDHPAWVGAICPTCHKRIHYGQDGDERNAELQERLKAKEAQPLS